MLERAKELTKESEGFRSEAYQDTGGVWTIGYGQTGKWVIRGLTCTEEQAEEWLDENYEKIVKQIHQVVRVSLNDNQLGALCDFIYNIGIGQFSSSTLLRLLNVGNYVGACDQLSKWVYDSGKKLPGLVTRREREQQLWNTGDWT